MKARATLLFEESAIKVIKRKQTQVQTENLSQHTKKQKPVTEEQAESSTSECGEMDENPIKDVDDIPDSVKYCRSIDPSMRRWIETTECRNKIVDATFDNPAHPKANKRMEPILLCL
jgi:glucosamine 6-phosphate synthetase-like amidotransferase/phosphosugar isomerase protein